MAETPSTGQMGMKKWILATCALFLLLAFSGKGQSGYEIKVNMKGSQDSAFYLAKYFFGQTVIVDSAKYIKKGQGVFKGSIDLDKGVYILANQSRQRYIDFLVNEKQKFTITGEFPNLVNTMASPNSQENEELFTYSRFLTNKNIEFQKEQHHQSGKNKLDSVKAMETLQVKMNEEIKKYDKEFMNKHKGTFVYDFLNLKNEKYLTDVPLAKNGRPDSVYQYYYYKNHYFDGVDFKDDRIILTPFFKDRITRYFESVIVQHPDTVIQELDKLLAQCKEGSLVYNTLLGHFTYKYETDKTMSFDKSGRTNSFEKVFVHLADNYITNGKAAGVYSDETVLKIKNRVNIIRNLLPGTKIPDLFAIDTASGRQVLNLGFDTTKSSKSASDLYARCSSKITPLYKTLYSLNAKYTILVFWSVDCGHCQKDIPKLNEDLKELKGKIDFKVFAVQTKRELFDKWRQFIISNKLDFINVFEPVPLNNLTERFDINRTPVIYLLDKDKRILGKNMSPEQLIEIIKDLESQT